MRVPVIPQASLVSDHDTFKEFLVEAGGVTWRIARLADLETLWDRIAEDDTQQAMAAGLLEDDAEAVDAPVPSCTGRRAGVFSRKAFEEDERLPYWTELWPSSYLLAEWLIRQQCAIAGKRCVDMGCGLGFTALMGCRLGARVIALDYEVEALAFARRNEARNRAHLLGGAPSWVCMDWRYPAFRKGTVDVVWAGDVVYEHRFITPVADFLDRVLCGTGVAWVAEPNRAVYAPFLTAMRQRGFSASKAWENSVVAHNWPACGVPVSVWEFRR